MSEDEEDSKPGVAVSGAVNVTDLLGLGKAAEALKPAAVKVLDSLTGSVAKVYEPVGIYLNSRAANAADRHNALADAKAYLNLNTGSTAVLQAMQERILSTEYRRQVNIAEAHLEAVQIAQDGPSDGPVRDVHTDFVASWIEGVKDVSEAEVRSAFARLLAAAPRTESGYISKPLVDFLKTLDGHLAGAVREAQELSRLTGGLIPYIVAGADELMEEIGIGAELRITALSLFDGALSLYASKEMSFFQMSVRARGLAAIVFPTKDEDADYLDLMDRLPGWLQSLTLGDPGQQIEMWVRAGHNKHAVFSLAHNYDALRPNHRSETEERIRDLQAHTLRERMLRGVLLKMVERDLPTLRFNRDDNLAY